MSIADDKLIRLNKNLTIDIFSKNITYLMIGFGHKSDLMPILSKSSKAAEFFGYQNDEFSLIQNIDPLLPTYVKEDHIYFVKQFMISGASKYFRR